MKNKKYSHIFVALLLILTMTMTLFTVVSASDKVYDLNVSFAAPEFSTTEITAALDRIQEASEGRLNFTYYYSWSITSVPNVIDDLNAGVVDIAAVPASEHLNRFPYTNLVTYTPFLGHKDIMTGAETFDELFEEYEVFQEEYEKAGLFYWTNYPCAPYNIFTNDNYEIDTPEKLNGLKLITSSAPMQQFITKSGGAPASFPVPEYATSMNTKAVDGLINHANVVAAFGVGDFIEGGTVFGESGTAMTLMTMCISKSTWEQLPEDLQQLFLDEKIALRDDQGLWEYEANARNLDSWPNLIYLDDEQVAEWKDALGDILDEYILEIEENGAEQASEIYEAVQEKIAEKIAEAAELAEQGETEPTETKEN